MRTLSILSTIFCVLIFWNVENTTAQGTGKVVCYFSSWAKDREGLAKYSIDNIPAEMCTHIIYSFIGLDESSNEVKVLDDGASGGFKQFTDLKSRNANAKFMVAIGGWIEGVEKYSTMAADSNKRQTFIASVVNFLKSYGFDGLDIDVECPGDEARGGTPDDKNNYLSLIQELRTAFDAENPQWEITMAVTIDPNLIQNGYRVTELCQTLNAIHVMSYDLRTYWNGFADVNSPLYKRSDETGFFATYNVEGGMMNWVNQGCSKDKLVVGIPFYGQTYTLSDASNNDVGAPTSGAGNPGQYTKTPGVLAYYEICPYVSSDEWTLKYHPENRCPYVYNGDQWIGFDDSKSIQEKMDFIKSNGYGGAMTWAIDQDDFQGQCGDKNPLLSVLYNSMRNYLPNSSKSRSAIGKGDFTRTLNSMFNMEISSNIIDSIDSYSNSKVKNLIDINITYSGNTNFKLIDIISLSYNSTI